MKIVKKDVFAAFSTVILIFSLVYVANEVNNRAIAQDPPNPPAPVVVTVPTLTLPTELKGEVGQFLEVKADTNGKEVKWAVLYPSTGLNLFPMDLLKDTSTAVAVANKDGVYYLHAWTALGDVPSDLATCKITIGTPAPVPVPPGPGPQPNPPVPPTPVTPTKLSVLFIDENSNYGTEDYKSYESIVNSLDLRAYLNSHCATYGSNNLPNWRKWDQNTDISNEKNPIWAKLMSGTTHTSLPWLVIADSAGNVLSSTAVPSNLADTMTLLKKFGGV